MTDPGASATSSRIVRVENIGGPFAGWVRATVDFPVPAAGAIPKSGVFGGIEFRRGRRTGLDTWAVDVNVSLAAGESIELDFADAEEETQPYVPLPDFARMGMLRCCDKPMKWVGGVDRDGAGWSCHLRSRDRDVVADVWATVYPGQPWCYAELRLTCSNPASAAVRQSGSWAITWGNSIVMVGAGTYDLADGQAMCVPLTIWWPEMGNLSQSWWDLHHRAVRAIGVQRLWPTGNPMLPPGGFDARAWTKAKLAPSWEALGDPSLPIVVGPNKRSQDTGAQEDQVFCRGEIMAPGGVHAATVAYLAAMRLGMRPCHHIEADGSPMTGEPTSPGRLSIYWNARPHAGVWGQCDHRGKPNPVPEAEFRGWIGPDNEHWLYGTLCSAARVIDSPCLQSLIEAQARVYPRWLTVEPGWYTSAPHAARSVGWEGIMAVQMWRTLADRVLADAVRGHWLARWERVLSVRLAGLEIWDVRPNDPRLGTGDWWLPWQQAVGAYGMDLAGEAFGVEPARQMALAAAKACLQRAWRQVDGRWRSTSGMPVDPSRDAEASFTDAWAYFGGAMAIATILRHEPQHEQARAIWQQLVDSATKLSETQWLAPEVQ